MKKVENGVLLTDKEASMIKNALIIGRCMTENPFEDFLYWDYEEESKNAKKMWDEMVSIGVV